MPKLVADATGVLITVVLLSAAVGLLLAAISTGNVVLAWGSVAVSAVVAVRIVVRWRRSWRRRHDDVPEDESLLLEEPADAAPGEKPPQPAPVSAAQEGDPGTVTAGVAASSSQTDSTEPPSAQTREHETEPDEEDTDAADLLVVYELTDEVLVVDEHPRYHLVRCRWPDAGRAERLPVREARELGFTPCARCRPDTTLARKRRAARTTTGGN